jgi:AcrR family transcriptional regulator
MSTKNQPRTSPVRRIVGTASRVFARTGFGAASLRQLAREAGVSRSVVTGHFQSKDQLFLAAQRATFQGLHRRFRDRALYGETGLLPALEALDAMWHSVRELRGGASFVVETLSRSGKPEVVAKELARFYAEATDMLEDGIKEVFGDKVGVLTVPPARMAVLIRIMLEGLVVELAQVRSADELARVDQAYADMRELFQRFVLAGTTLPTFDPDSEDPVPLPW